MEKECNFLLDYYEATAAHSNTFPDIHCKTLILCVLSVFCFYLLRRENIKNCIKNMHIKTVFELNNSKLHDSLQLFLKLFIVCIAHKKRSK